MHRLHHGQVGEECHVSCHLCTDSDRFWLVCAEAKSCWQVRRLPVVDDDGHLVGIFTRGDVIKAALEARRSAAGSN